MANRYMSLSGGQGAAPLPMSDLYLQGKEEGIQANRHPLLLIIIIHLDVRVFSVSNVLKWVQRGNVCIEVNQPRYQHFHQHLNFGFQVIHGGNQLKPKDI